jgi:hypothetical protein
MESLLDGDLKISNYRIISIFYFHSFIAAPAFKRNEPALKNLLAE